MADTADMILPMLREMRAEIAEMHAAINERVGALDTQLRALLKLQCVLRDAAYQPLLRMRNVSAHE